MARASLSDSPSGGPANGAGIGRARVGTRLQGKARPDPDLR